MTSTLHNRVCRVAHRARRLVQLYGIGWFLTILCSAALTVGWLDYIIRFQDLGIRFICSLLLFSILLLGFARFIVMAWRYRCSALRAARQIESVYPQLSDKLTSAVAFSADLLEGEAEGSVELRRAVIDDAERTAEQLDFNRCLDPRRPLRALIVAALLIVTVLILTLINGPLVAVAAKRMLAPWSDNPWPQQHVLQWVGAPTRLAIGQDFEARLTDAKGQLPEQVEIHYWFAGDDLSEIQKFEMQPLGPHLVHRLANITRPFRYRATGGDDQTMPWRDVTLVEPPRILECEVRLHPPEYTGLESRRAEGSFQALTETRATVRGRTNKPLSAALLETNTQGANTSIRLKLGDGRRSFFLEDAATCWAIRRSGTYGVRLVDLEGLDIGVTARWDIQAVRDLPPTVSLKRPAADLLVTPVARLALEAIVKDDFAVRSVELTFVPSTSANHSEETFPLWNGPPESALVAQPERREGSEGVQRNVEYVWDLTDLSFMEPGQWIDFKLITSDYKSQQGESVSRRLTFISSEELEERIAQRQSELLAQIAEIVRLQQDTRGQTTDLQIQLREANTLAQNDVDQLKAAELNQRQVQQRLGHPKDGIAAQLLALLDQARSNGIDTPDLIAQLKRYHETIQRLKDGPLSRTQHQLIDAVKTVRLSLLDSHGKEHQLGPSSRDELAGLFDHIDKGQKQIIETLEQLLGELRQWDNYQRLVREVARLRRQEEQLYNRTRQLRIETLAQATYDLAAQQRADLKRLTEQQNDVALQFDKLSGSMEAVRTTLRSEDPPAAARLASAIAMIRQDGVGGLIRDIRLAMNRNQLGQAVEQQEQLIDMLRRLQDVLANRRHRQLERRVASLLDAASQLDRIRVRQEEIQRQTQKTESASSRQFQKWAEQEGQLSDDVKTLTQTLEEQSAEAPIAMLTDAGDSLQEAEQAASNRDLPRTRQASKEAQSLLEQAQRRINATLAASQQAFQQERIDQLRQSVREFLSRQSRLLDKTQKAERQRPAKDIDQDHEWLKTVQTLAADQGTLSQAVDELATNWSDAMTFTFALQNAAQSMTVSSRRLRANQTGSETVKWQQQAMSQLDHILQAVSREPSNTQPSDRQDGQRQTTKGNPQPGTQYLLAQLRLIRAMQTQVNRQTELLEQASEPWEVTQEARHRELVQQQRRLADILHQLLKRSAAGTDTEDDFTPLDKLDTPAQLSPEGSDEI